MPTVHGKTDKIFKRLLKDWCCSRCAPSLQTLLKILHNNVQQVLLCVVMHEKQAAVNANMEHVEILDAGVELIRESDPARVQWWKTCPRGLLKIVWDDREDRAPQGWDSARSGASGDARGSSAVCCITAIKPLPCLHDQRMLLKNSEKRACLRKSNQTLLVLWPVSK